MPVRRICSRTVGNITGGIERKNAALPLMPCVLHSSFSVSFRVSNAVSSSKEPGTNFTRPESRFHTSSLQLVRAWSLADFLARSSKSPSPQSLRAKPSRTKSVGSRPRLARS
jgi:hypothetical protein